MVALLQDFRDVCGLYFGIWFVLLAVGQLEVWPHVVRPVAQLELEIFVAEDLLIVAKDWICKFGVKAGHRSKSILGRGQKCDIQRLIGVREPWDVSVQLSLVI